MKKKNWKLPLVFVFTILLTFCFSWMGFETHSRKKKSNPRKISPRKRLDSDELNNISIFKKSSKSVVYITKMQRRFDYNSFNAYNVPRGTGSGFVWDKRGHIVTNFHVIQNHSGIRVRLADHTTWDAQVVGSDPSKDIAVLKIAAPNKKLYPLLIGKSGDLLVGQKVLAIGNPFGLDFTLTTGVVSSLNRMIKSVSGQPIRGVIQTDAAINPGNSGGPLLDSSGRLIGINTAIKSTTRSSAGIGFAVPVDTVNLVVPKLINFGVIRPPRIGIYIYNNPSWLKLYGKKGVIVEKVAPGTPAEKAGIRGMGFNEFGDIILGDIIIAVNQKPVVDQTSLRTILDDFNVGDTITLTVDRQGQILKVPLRLY